MAPKADPELESFLLPEVDAVALPLIEILPLQMLTILMAQQKGIEAGRFRFVQKITLRE
jgi:glucosamine 6-phosphate synthetase-like amidotransferase/phosphosugar isomerase protein